MIAAALALCACAGEAVDPDRPNIVGFATLQDDRLSGPTTISAAGSGLLDSVRIVVTINRNGRVIDAALAESGWQRMIRSLSFWNGEASRTEQALEAARQWRFRPQRFDGRPVQAVGIITIKYLQPEIAANPAAVFPNGAPADTEMMLERTGCYGSCPAYKVSISGQGRVRFSADGAHSYVAWPGIHEARVSPQVAAELIEAFRSAHFAGLRPACEVAAIDSPTYLLTLRRGGRTIQVEDHLAGQTACRPA